MTSFPNRTVAGQELALRFYPNDARDAVLVAIPNGGIPVALPLADRLNLPVHLCVVAKIPSLYDPRVGLGAVDALTIHYNHHHVSVFREAGLLSDADLNKCTRVAFQTVHRREYACFPKTRLGVGRPLLPEVEDRTIILVDDGIATGYTALAAIRKLERGDPRRIIVASPVCSGRARSTFDQACVPVELVALVEDQSPAFMVDDHYVDFRQLSDGEALRMWSSQPLASCAGVLTDVSYVPLGLSEL